MQTPKKEDVVYGFIAEYYDNQAQMSRRYQLRYYTENHEIEMMDDKTRKLFLKRSSAPPSLGPKDFYLGAQILIHGRSLELVEYLDPSTKTILESQRQRTMAIITPDAFNNMGKIVDAICRNGFSVSKLKMFLLSREEAQELHRKQQGTAFFDNLVSHMSSGPVVALELVAEDSIKKFQNLLSALRARYSAGNLDTAVEGASSPAEVEEWQNFFFGRKHTPTAAYESGSCCVILPHVVKEGKAGQVLDMIQQQSFEISALGLFNLTKAQAEEFLEVYQGVIPHFAEIVTQLCSGPCIALEVRSNDPVTSFREVAGPWDVEMAKELRPHTIRAKFGVDRARPGIHCTDLEEDAVSEVQYFFDLLSSQP